MNRGVPHHDAAIGKRGSRLAAGAQSTLAAFGVAALATMAAAPLQAADLGGLRVLSPSGEPLRAEIAVTTVTRQEADTLKVQLASPDVYRQTQLDYNEALANLKLEIQDRPQGRKVVSITSATPVDATVLDLLVELTWNMGRFIRQYTFVLNAPPPVASAPAAAETTRTVAPGDTLSAIARDIRPEGASLAQALAALTHANPQALVDGNMNRLRAGATLALPAADAIAAESAPDAAALFASQAQAYDAYRQRLAGQAGQALADSAPAGAAASGSIEPAPAGQPAAAADAGDALKLSSDGRRGVAGDVQGDRDRAADEQDAAGKAVREAESRVQDLQGNVDAMRNLLEARNDTLAKAEQQGPAEARTGLAARVSDNSVAVLGGVVAVLAAVLGAFVLNRRGERRERQRLDDDAPLAPPGGLAGVAPAAGAAGEGRVNHLADWDAIAPFPIPDHIPPAAARLDDPDDEDPGFEPGSRPPPTPPAGFGFDLNLNLDTTPQDTPDFAAKLALARSYADLGDRPAARELLEDILRGGTAEQQNRARMLLASL